MKDWLKPYLVEKSIEALRESGTDTKEDKQRAGKPRELEIERKYERVPVKFPVVYEIGGVTLTGTTVNVCNEGMMVESYVPSRRLTEVFEILTKNENCRLPVRCIHGGKTYLREAEVKHFHLHSSGTGPCRLMVGFLLPIVDD